jgi:ribonuclease HII
MLYLGIDDAGRGPLIGPMYLAGVLVDAKTQQVWTHEGVADSKTLSDKERFRLAGIIKDECKKYKIIESTPQEIDHAVEKGGINLNTLEALKAGAIINELMEGVKEPVTIVVDCPSINTQSWKATLMHYVKNQSLTLLCEHKADANHPSVSAASILAKCAREEAMHAIQKDYGNTGSGYPADPITKAFLTKYGLKYKDAGIFRKSWATWKALFPSTNDQKTLF